MSRKPFTDEEILLLRQNPYTYSVTTFQLNLTKEFKEIFYSEYQKGELPRKILEDHGYDPAGAQDLEHFRPHPGTVQEIRLFLRRERHTRKETAPGAAG